MFGRFDFGAKDGDADGQACSARDVNPRRRGQIGIGGAQLLPTESWPERPAIVRGQSQIEKKKNQKKPKHVGTNRKVRAITESLLDLRRGEMLRRRKIKNQSKLNEQNAAKSEESEQKKMKP